MNSELIMEIERIAKEKRIPRESLIGAIEEAILAAARKVFGVERNLNAEFNEERSVVDLWQSVKAVKEVTDTFNEISLERLKDLGIGFDEDGEEFLLEDGDEINLDIYYLDSDQELAREQDEMYGDILGIETHRKTFGRVAAQTAKQVIIQRLRDAEKGRVYGEYAGRRHDLVTGRVVRYERGNLIVDIGRAEAILPGREKIPNENYRAADRVQAWVKDVLEQSRGPQVILSRTAPEFLIKLFELEVPEIAEGVVRIESASREPGIRAKIAVSSRDRDVDPVGACVGMKGARVQAVVQELRGEKIDIVPWSEDPATFVCNALQPAEVSRVLIDEARKRMEIIVPDDQLSLAIGRRGQNVRLASKLSGWQLDIHSESRIQEIRDRAWESMSKVGGVNEFLIQTLYNHGIRSAEDISKMDPAFLGQFPGIDADAVPGLLQLAAEVAAQEEVEAEQAREMAEDAARASQVAKDYQQILGLDAEGRMRAIRGMGDATYKALSEGAIDTVEKLAEGEVESVVAYSGITHQKAKQMIYGAKRWLEHEVKTDADVKRFGIVLVDGVAKTPAAIEEEKRRAEEEAQKQAEMEAEQEANALEVEGSSEG